MCGWKTTTKKGLHKTLADMKNKSRCVFSLIRHIVLGATSESRIRKCWIDTHGAARTSPGRSCMNMQTSSIFKAKCMYNALKLKFPGQNIMWKSRRLKKIHERRTTSEWIMHSPKAQQHTALGSSPNSINSEKNWATAFFHTRSRLYGVELCALPLLKWAVNIDFLLGRFTVTCYTFRGNVSLVEWKRNHRGGDDAADALVKISLFRRYVTKT